MAGKEPGGTSIEGGSANAGGGGPGGGEQGGGTPAHTGVGDRLTIVINHVEYQVDKPSLTGAELKRLANEPPDRVVMWIKRGPGADQNEDDETIPDDRPVTLVPGMEFRIVNAGTFG